MEQECVDPYLTSSGRSRPSVPSLCLPLGSTPLWAARRVGQLRSESLFLSDTLEFMVLSFEALEDDRYWMFLQIRNLGFVRSLTKGEESFGWARLAYASPLL